MSVSLCLSAGTLTTSDPKEDVVFDCNSNPYLFTTAFDVDNFMGTLCTYEPYNQHNESYLYINNVKAMIQIFAVQSIKLNAGQHQNDFSSYPNQIYNFKQYSTPENDALIQKLIDKGILENISPLKWEKLNISRHEIKAESEHFIIHSNEIVTTNGYFKDKIYDPLTKKSIDFAFNKPNSMRIEQTQWSDQSL